MARELSNGNGTTRLRMSSQSFQRDYSQFRESVKCQTFDTWVCLNKESHPRGGKKGLSLTYSLSPHNCVAQMDLKCDPTADTSTRPTLKEYDIDDRCHVTLEWVSPFGCPLCRSDDFTFTDSKCVNEILTRQYYQINAFCHG